MTSFLSNIYWIGGSPCAGKSTIASAIVQSCNIPVYRCDDAYLAHQRLISPDHQPVYSRLSQLSGDSLWMRPVDRQISEERALYREEFPFILEDLRRLAGAGPVIAEGAALLPALFDECEIPDRRCVWIVPTETFQRARYAQREWRHDVLTSCTDPEQAWKNWLDRDAGFARSVVQDAQRRNRRVMIVDSQTVDAMIDDVVSWFELSP